MEKSYLNDGLSGDKPWRRRDCILMMACQGTSHGEMMAKGAGRWSYLNDGLSGDKPWRSILMMVCQDKPWRKEDVFPWSDGYARIL
jgi:hypothetical protein